jgi:hypothetical protein
MFPSHADKFCLQNIVMNPCLVSCDNVLDKFLTTNTIMLQNYTAQAISYFLCPLLILEEPNVHTHYLPLHSE